MRQISFLNCVELVGETCTPYSGAKKYVSTGAVDVDYINETDTEIFSYEDKPSRANLIAQPGDILFAKMMSTKKTLQINDAIFQYIYSTGFCAVRAKSDIITDRCLYYLLTSKSFQSQKDKNCSGATQKAITNEGLRKIKISIPPLTQQTAVVSILDTLSDIIKKYHCELHILDTIVRTRFVEMFGDPVDNDRHWPTQALNKICTAIVDCPHSTPSYTTDNTGYMCIRTSIVKKNRILWDEIEYIPEQEYMQRTQRKRPEKGDIVYTREGAILGIAAMIDRECNVALGQRSMLLSPNVSKCLPQFLCTAMNFDSFLRNALGGISGSASPHINVGDIKAFEIILPPIELQKKFVIFVNQTNKSKAIVQSALDKAQLLFDSLMQKYFG